MGAAFPNPENPGSDKKAVRLGNRTYRPGNKTNPVNLVLGVSQLIDAK